MIASPYDERAPKAVEELRRAAGVNASTNPKRESYSLAVMVCGRIAVLVTSFLLAGCLPFDRGNMRYISVAETVQPTKSGASTESVGGEIESILVEHGFREQTIKGWYWRGKSGPGVLVTISHEDDSFAVEIVQGLFGPMGPNRKFKAVFGEIRDLLIREFGDQVVIRDR